VRPNLALGPLDSATQYLLYLSIVVLGVLLPLLVQKWRTRREKAALLARTLLALKAEATANRRRVQESLRTLENLRDQLDRLRGHRLAMSRHLRDPAEAVPEEPPEETDWGVSVPLITRTAWDVARLADALVLMPEAQLSAFTRVFHIQEVFERDRPALLAMLIQIELLSLPADMARAETVDAQLHTLTVGLATVRYHVGLAQGMITAYDAALAAPA
jgi:type VI protein secretion system component VasK